MLKAFIHSEHCQHDFSLCRHFQAIGFIYTGSLTVQLLCWMAKVEWLKRIEDFDMAQRKCESSLFSRELITVTSSYGA